jgi:hypothetical protein
MKKNPTQRRSVDEQALSPSSMMKHFREVSFTVSWISSSCCWYIYPSTFVFFAVREYVVEFILTRKWGVTGKKK